MAEQNTSRFDTFFSCNRSCETFAELVESDASLNASLFSQALNDTD